ncbi:MAG: hypothetical protein ABSC51_06470 [Gaiellaceae bacterium]|jgi:uncharacterized protein (DUF697 family)
MLSVLAAFGFTVSRRMTEAGVVLGLVGAILLVLGGLPFMKRFGTIIGGLCLVAAFLLIGIAVHWGVNPYLRVK